MHSPCQQPYWVCSIGLEGPAALSLVCVNFWVGVFVLSSTFEFSTSAVHVSFCVCCWECMPLIHISLHAIYKLFNWMILQSCASFQRYFCLSSIFGLFLRESNFLTWRLDHRSDWAAPQLHAWPWVMTGGTWQVKWLVFLKSETFERKAVALNEIHSWLWNKGDLNVLGEAEMRLPLIYIVFV